MKILPSFLFLWFLPNLLQAQPCQHGVLIGKTAEAIRVGDFSLAEKEADEGLACAEKNREVVAQFDWMMRRYEALRNQRKSKNALAAALIADDFFAKNKIGKSSLPLETALAEAFAMQKDSLNGLLYLSKAQSLALQSPPLSIKEMAWLKYVEGYWQFHFLKKQDKALALWLQALQVLQDDPDTEVFLQGQILRWLGNAARSQGDFQQALSRYGEELALYQNRYPPTQPDLAICHFNLGGVHHELLNHSQALEHYLRCYAVWEKQPPAKAYLRMLTEATADMYWELGDREKAIQFYDLSSDGGTPESRDSSLMLSRSADSLMEGGKHDVALRFYQQALAFRERNFGNNHPLTAACQNFVGRSLAATGKTDEALAAYQRSISMLSEGFDDPSPFVNPPLDADIPSVHYLLEALAGKGSLLLQIAEKNGGNRQLQSAFETLQLAVAYLEQLRRSPMGEASKQFWNRRSQPLLEDALRAALLLHRRTGNAHWLEAAFAFSEKSRGFLLTAALQGEQAVHFAGVPESLTGQEQALRQHILDYENKISGEEQRCSEARQNKLELWREKLAVLRSEHDRLIGKLRQEYPRYFSFKYGSPSVGLTDLQRSLGEQDAALLEFFEGEKWVYVFYVDAHRVIVFEIENTTDFQLLITGFANLLQNKDRFLRQPAEAFKEFTENARQLYGLLLDPPLSVCSEEIERLLIVPGHRLSSVPFACLLTADLPEDSQRDYSNLPYLLRRFSIFYAPSASIWVQAATQESKGERGMGYAGFAPDYTGSSYPGMPSPVPLLFSKKEVKAAGNAFRGEVFLGKNATEKAFRSQSARLLHLAAHALPDAENPLLSKLLLLPADTTEDGILHAYEIYGLRLPARLVLLSACHSAAGQYESGEGMMSLERAFQYAGCPSLLTTLWAADDGAAASMTSNFWENIQAGLPKDVALQQAQLRFLEEGDPASAAPFYWAGWRMAGAVDVVEMGGTPWWVWVVVVLGGFVLVLIFQKL